MGAVMLAGMNGGCAPEPAVPARRRRRGRATLAGLVGLLCLQVGHPEPLLPVQPVAASVPAAGLHPPAPWQLAGLPHQSKPVTQYHLVPLEGRLVLKVEAQSSYGNLVHPLPEHAPSTTLSWRWRVDQPLAHPDLHQRSGDDTALKVCALFDMDEYAVPFMERQVLRLARLRSHEHLPAATVCYVWDHHLPAGTVLDNAFTRRMRLIVVRGEGSALHAWTSERRNLQADFLRLFGDESQQVPRLMAVAVSADADNTQGHSLAYLSDLNLE
jgi:hypothetical protein